MKPMKAVGLVCALAVMGSAPSQAQPPSPQQSAVIAGVYKELTMSTDRTLALVAPTTGQVSENFLVYLVNSGQATENVEQGASDSSASTTYTIPPVATPVGPGQTAYVTVTVRGTGGGFPYWIDYWAQIAGAEETRKTARFVIDTVGTGVRPVAQRSSRPHALRVTVLPGDGRAVIGVAAGTPLAVFQPNGRLVWSWVGDGRTARLSPLSAGPALVRVR